VFQPEPVHSVWMAVIVLAEITEVPVHITER